MPSANKTPDFYLEDVQDFYNLELIVGTQLSEAKRRTVGRFRLRALTINPVGRIVETDPPSTERPKTSTAQELMGGAPPVGMESAPEGVVAGEIAPEEPTTTTGAKPPGATPAETVNEAATHTSSLIDQAPGLRLYHQRNREGGTKYLFTDHQGSPLATVTGKKIHFQHGITGDTPVGADIEKMARKHKLVEAVDREGAGTRGNLADVRKEAKNYAKREGTPVHILKPMPGKAPGFRIVPDATYKAHKGKSGFTDDLYVERVTESVCEARGWSVAWGKERGGGWRASIRTQSGKGWLSVGMSDKVTAKADAEKIAARWAKEIKAGKSVQDLAEDTLPHYVQELIDSTDEVGESNEVIPDTMSRGECELLDEVTDAMLAGALDADGWKAVCEDAMGDLRKWREEEKGSAAKVQAHVAAAQSLRRHLSPNYKAPMAAARRAKGPGVWSKVRKAVGAAWKRLKVGARKSVFGRPMTWTGAKWVAESAPGTDEAAPPGFSGTVKSMLDKHGMTASKAYALAWSMYRKGARPHKKKEKGKPRYTSPEKYFAKRKATREAIAQSDPEAARDDRLVSLFTEHYDLG